MRRFLRCLAVVTVVLILGSAFAGYSMYQATQRAPDFYVRMLDSERTAELASGPSFEHQIQELQEESQRPGTWEAVFTEDQINGWLAVGLAQEFPKLLPPQVHEPRVAISPEQVQVGCSYRGARLSSVISFSLLIALTDEPNTLEIRVQKARIGRLPAPINQFLNQIASAIKTTNVPFRWEPTDGDPIARITVPSSHPDYAHREIYLDTVELRQGEVRLAGRTAAKGNQPTVARSSRTSPIILAYQR